MSIRERIDHEPRPGVRTFTPRWRTSPLTQERIDTLLPRYQIPDGRLVPTVVFGRSAPVVLEIGSGHGAAALAYATTFPDVDVLAVEVHVPGVVRMLARAEQAGLTNLRVERGDALPLLRERIAPQSLAAIHLFFPDPWPKNKHGKRRFVQQHSLGVLASRLAPGSPLVIATDHEVYAEHVHRQLAIHGGWQVVVGERPSWRPDDGFEAKGLRAGRTIHEIRATRLSAVTTVE